MARKLTSTQLRELCAGMPDLIPHTDTGLESYPVRVCVEDTDETICLVSGEVDSIRYAELFACAPRVIPALLNEVGRLRGEVAAFRRALEEEARALAEYI